MSKVNIRIFISHFTMHNSVYTCASCEHCCILLIKSNGFQCTLLLLCFNYLKSIHVMPNRQVHHGSGSGACCPCGCHNAGCEMSYVQLSVFLAFLGSSTSFFAKTWFPSLR